MIKPTPDDSPADADQEAICDDRYQGWVSLLSFLAAEPGSPMVEVSPGVYVVQKSGDTPQPAP